jgi:hypothetical protein
MDAIDQASLAGKTRAIGCTALVMRLVPSLVAAVVFGVYVVIWHVNRPLYLPVIEWFDSTPGKIPFGDLGATLLAVSCSHDGVNVLVANTCMHGGWFNYSPLLLRVPLFGLSPADTMPAGVFMGFFFIAACALLPPPRGMAALVMRCMAVCSCSVVHALEAGNIDALIFVLCLAGLLLVQAGGIAALTGYAMFMIGGAIKFYPATLLVLVFRERRPLFWTIAAFVAMAVAAYMFKFGHDLVTILSGLPAGVPFAGTFGAINVPFGLALLMFLPHLSLWPPVPDFFAAVEHPYVAQYIFICARLLVVAGILTGLQLAPRYRPMISRMPPDRLIFLVGGAALMAFCFDLAGNFEYRGVFLLFPLAALGDSGLTTLPDKHLARPLQLVILFLLCDRFLRQLVGTLSVAALGAKQAVYPEIAFWLVREYCWWWLVAQFSAIIISFIKLRLPLLMPAQWVV